jgi:hypothetical protein
MDLSFDGIDAFGEGVPYIQTCSQLANLQTAVTMSHGFVTK